MSYSTLAIANYLLELANSQKITDVTPMKIQKLVYYAHGWHLGATGDTLINEQVEAWKYGPVIATIYNSAKRYGNQPIKAPLKPEFAEAFGGEAPSLGATEKEELKPLLTWILDQYGGLSGLQLSNLTHNKEEPWHKIYQEKFDGDAPRGTDIPQDEIQSYFANQVTQLQEIGA